MQLGFLERLYGHMAWADAMIWRSVFAEEIVGRDDYVLDSLVHLHMVQRAYLALWHGEEVETPRREDFGGPADIRDWARSYHARAAVFVGELSEERLDEVIALPAMWTDFIASEIGGPLSAASLGDMVFQVPAHSLHHRAQINRRIREVGGTPGMVDYIGWVWRGAPPAEWTG